MVGSILSKIKNVVRCLRKGAFSADDQPEIPRLTERDLGDIKRFFPLPKYFIFGHARSGTTLTARLIRLHPEVHCNWQGHFFTRHPTLQGLIHSGEVKHWLDGNSNRWNQGEPLTPLVLRACADFIMERQALDLGKTIVGDKSPNTQLKGEAVRRLHSFYPDGKLIFVVRDGRDVVLSHRIQAFIDFPEFLSPVDLRIRDDFAAQPEPYYAGEKSIFTPDWLRRDLEHWVDNLQDTSSWASQLFGESYRALQYENLISSPEEVLRALWRFLGVENLEEPDVSRIDQELKRNPDKDWQKEQNQAIIRNLEKGKSGTWKELFTDRDQRLVKEIAGQTLMDWGYETGMDW